MKMWSVSILTLKRQDTLLASYVEPEPHLLYNAFYCELC